MLAMEKSKERFIMDEFDLSMSSLSQRIQTQKTFFLLQKLGLDLKYRFGFYIYGPYSTELAACLYSMPPDVVGDDSIRNEGAIAKMKIISSSLADIPCKTDIPKRIEYAADMIYFFDSTDDIEEIKKLIVQKHDYLDVKELHFHIPKILKSVGLMAT